MRVEGEGLLRNGKVWKAEEMIYGFRIFLQQVIVSFIQIFFYLFFSNCLQQEYDLSISHFYGYCLLKNIGFKII